MTSNPFFRQEVSKIEEKRKHFAKKGWLGEWVELLKIIMISFMDNPQVSAFCDRVWFIRSVLKTQYIWIELFRGSPFNLEASSTNFSLFLSLEICYLSGTVCETTKLSNVFWLLNEEIVSEMWQKVKMKSYNTKCKNAENTNESFLTKSQKNENENICFFCHNFWTNQDLELINTSKWPSESQFHERWSYSWQKNGRK